MGQYHSPYLAMGNNPVSMVDPDGGYDNSCSDDGLSQFNSFTNHSYINGDMDRSINEQQAMGLLKHEYNEYKAEHYKDGEWGSYETATLHTTYGDQTNKTIFVIDPTKKKDRPTFAVGGMTGGAADFSSLKVDKLSYKDSPWYRTRVDVWGSNALRSAW